MVTFDRPAAPMTQNTRHTGVWPRGASNSKHTSETANTKMGHCGTLRPTLGPKGRQSAEPCTGTPTPTPSKAKGRDKNYKALSE